MNSKRSTTSLTITLMILSLVSVASTQQDAFARSLGMSITATAEAGSNTIAITGKTISDITDITFRVTSPSGNNVVDLAQITPAEDGTFSKMLKVGPTWTEDGFYKITATQSMHRNSLYNLNIEVEVINQMTAEISTTASNLETGIFTRPEMQITENAGIQMTADAVIGSTMIGIMGQTDRTNQDVTLTVTAPNGNVMSVYQVSPTLGGTFSTVINIGGELWKQDGLYTVTAQQLDDVEYTASAQVDIKDGKVIPEFGAVAAMILAVAVIAIIAVSARSRISIIPRY